MRTQEVHSKEEIKNPDENKASNNIQKDQNVICEPSIIEKDENEESSSDDYKDKIDFNVKSQEASEISQDDVVIVEAKSNQNKNKAHSFSCNKIMKENQGIHSAKTVQTEVGENLFKGNIKVERLEREFFKGKTNEKNLEGDQTDVSCNIPLQTGIRIYINS